MDEDGRQRRLVLNGIQRGADVPVVPLPVKPVTGTGNKVVTLADTSVVLSFDVDGMSALIPHRLLPPRAIDERLYL